MRAFNFAAMALALAFSGLGASGCTTLASDALNRPVAGATLMDEKALIGLEAAAVAANVAADAAVDTGLLKPGSPRAIQVADTLVRVRQATQAAQAAHSVGNAATVQAKTVEALALVGLVTSLIRSGR